MTPIEAMRGELTRGLASESTIRSFVQVVDDLVDERSIRRPHVRGALRRAADHVLRQLDRWTAWRPGVFRAHAAELLDRAVLAEPLDRATRPEVLLELLKDDQADRSHVVAASRILISVLGEPCLDGVAWTWEEVQEAEAVVEAYRVIFGRPGRGT